MPQVPKARYSPVDHRRPLCKQGERSSLCCFKVLVTRLPLFLLAPTQNFPDLERSACNRNSKANEARRRPKKLSNNISALYFVQDPQEADLRPGCTNY